MDFTQNKLTKAEWENIEIPVLPEEKKILEMIIKGFADVNIRSNETLSIMSYIKMENTPEIEYMLYKKYFEEIPKYFNETTKENIIKWLLKADQFPFESTYKNKSEYKQLESKVDKSILTKEKKIISGHDVIYFYDRPKNSSSSLDF